MEGSQDLAIFNPQLARSAVEYNSDFLHIAHSQTLNMFVLIKMKKTITLDLSFSLHLVGHRLQEE